MDSKTGTFFEASNFFQKEESEIFSIRYDIEVAYQDKKHTPLYTCSFCGKPVKIRGGLKKCLHFQHFYDASKCPYYNGKNLTKKEILKRKYNGQKESLRHFELKNRIAELLAKNKNISNITVDERRYSTIDMGKWRKPDVYAEYNGKKVVFEIQLSTTFVSVVAERNTYYEKNKTYVIWIFDKFNLDRKSLNYTEKDIYYPLTRGAFAFDLEARNESTKKHDLILSCHYELPKLIDNSISEIPTKKQITLSDIIFDEEKYEAYYFDFDKVKKEVTIQLYENAELITKELRTYYQYNKIPYDLEQKISKLAEFEKNYVCDKLKKADSGLFLEKLVQGNHHYAFLGFITNKLFDGHTADIEKHCSKMIKERLSTVDIPVTTEINKMLFALASLKINKVIKYKIPTILGLSNWILEGKKNLAYIYVRALKIYNRLYDIQCKDKKGTFEKKLNNFYKEKTRQNNDFDTVFKAVFPELFQRI